MSEAQPTTTPGTEMPGAPPPAAPKTPSLMSDADKKPEGDPAKPEGEKKVEAKPGEVPETYELKSSIEGVELSKELIEEFTPLAKELKLDNAQAQKVADLGVKILAGARDAAVAAHVERVQSWANEAVKDAEFGGDKLAESLGTAKTAVIRFGGQKLLDVLHETGLENHPELIRAFVRVGRAMKDDNFAASLGEGGGKKPEAADVLYPQYSNGAGR